MITQRDKPLRGKAHCPHTDLVLLGKLPSRSTGHEATDECLRVCLAQAVDGPSLPEAWSDCPNTNCYTVCIGQCFGELPGRLAQIMQQVSAVQVALEEVDRLDGLCPRNARTRAVRHFVWGRAPTPQPAGLPPPGPPAFVPASDLAPRGSRPVRPMREGTRDKGQTRPARQE